MPQLPIGRNWTKPTSANVANNTTVAIASITTKLPRATFGKMRIETKQENGPRHSAAATVSATAQVQKLGEPIARPNFVAGEPASKKAKVVDGIALITPHPSKIHVEVEDGNKSSFVNKVNANPDPFRPLSDQF